MAGSGKIDGVGTPDVAAEQPPSQERIKLSPELQKEADALKRVEDRKNRIDALQKKIEKAKPSEDGVVNISFEEMKQDGKERFELATLQLEVVTEAWKNEKDPLKRLDLFKQQNALKKELKLIQEQIAQAETIIQEQKKASIDRALQEAQRIAKPLNEPAASITKPPDIQPPVQEGPDSQKRLTREEGIELAKRLREYDNMSVVSPLSPDFTAPTANSGEAPVVSKPKRTLLKPSTWFQQQ